MSEPWTGWNRAQRDSWGFSKLLLSSPCVQSVKIHRITCKLIRVPQASFPAHTLQFRTTQRREAGSQGRFSRTWPRLIPARARKPPKWNPGRGKSSSSPNPRLHPPTSTPVTLALPRRCPTRLPSPSFHATPPSRHLFLLPPSSLLPNLPWPPLSSSSPLHPSHAHPLPAICTPGPTYPVTTARPSRPTHQRAFLLLWNRSRGPRGRLPDCPRRGPRLHISRRAR